VSVIRLGLRQARHTVVAVAQNLDPPAVVLLQMSTAGGKALQQQPASGNIGTVMADAM